jgi:hypothetical protein
VAKFVTQSCLGGRVEPVPRFIERQQSNRGEESLSQTNLLAVALGEGRHGRIEPGLKREGFGQGFDPWVSGGAIETAQPSHVPQVYPPRHADPSREAFGHVTDGCGPGGHPASRRTGHTHQDAEQRGFPRAVGADYLGEGPRLQ